VGIPVGGQAPDATVREADGREVRLREAGKPGPVLLVFYRGGWCPYCNSQIHELTTAYPEYQKRGVTPVAISVDRAEESAKTQATYSIPFPVLSDPELAAHRAYRVLHQVDEAEYARLKGFGIDLEKASGQGHHVIAVPSIFVIDGKGVVRWAHADPDYKVRPSTAQVLAAIDGLKLAQP
jgi:peroxiredoxin